MTMKVSKTFCRQNSQGQKITQPLPAFGWQSRTPSTTFRHTLCPDFPLYQKRKSRHLSCPDFLKCVFDEDENRNTKCGEKNAEGFRLSDKENRGTKIKGLPTVGLEPTIFRLGGGRLIH